MATAPQLLSAREVASRLNVSESHARNVLASGQLETVRIGQSIRVTESELARYITANTHAAPRNRLRKIGTAA